MSFVKFKYLPHTADAAFTAYGKTEKKMIENAAAALLNMMLDVKRVRALRKGTARAAIREKADTMENVVWFILQDILSLVDARKLDAYSFRLTALDRSGTSGAFTARGEILYKRSGENLALMSVKAVTPHGMSVTKKNGIYSVSVVVDV